MQRRATARPRYPASATYSFRIQLTERYQACNPIFCITRTTSLLSLLSFGPQYHLHGIQYQRTLDWPPSSSPNHCFRITYVSTAVFHLLLVCPTFHRLSSLCAFVLDSVTLPSTKFNPSPHAFPSTFPPLNSLLMLALTLSLVDVLIKLRNRTHNILPPLLTIILTHLTYLPFFSSR